MRDHDDGRAALVQLADELQHLLAPLGVQHRRRLVEHDDVRFDGQHARDGQPLLLPAGQRVRVAFLETGQMDQVESGGDARGDLAVGEIEVLQAERHVLAGHGRDELVVGVLEHHAAGLAHGPQVRAVRGVQAGDAQRAAVAGQKSVEMAGERGFAAAVVADDGEEFAFADRQGHAVERRNPSVVGEADRLSVDDAHADPRNVADGEAGDPSPRRGDRKPRSGTAQGETSSFVVVFTASPAENRPHQKEERGGASRIRTGDPLLAKQMRYQLRYSPSRFVEKMRSGLTRI